MKIVIFCKGIRGMECLKHLCKEGADLSMIVLQQGEPLAGEIGTIAQKCGAEVFTPSDTNSKDSLHRLRKEDADVFVLAGYGLILKKECLSIPKKDCLLPQENMATIYHHQYLTSSSSQAAVKMSLIIDDT